MCETWAWRDQVADKEGGEEVRDPGNLNINAGG